MTHACAESDPQAFEVQNPGSESHQLIPIWTVSFLQGRYFHETIIPQICTFMKIFLSTHSLKLTSKPPIIKRHTEQQFQEKAPSKTKGQNNGNFTYQVDGLSPLANHLKRHSMQCMLLISSLYIWVCFIHYVICFFYFSTITQSTECIFGGLENESKRVPGKRQKYSNSP